MSRYVRDVSMEPDPVYEKMKWLIVILIVAGLGHGIVIEQLVI